MDDSFVGVALGTSNYFGWLANWTTIRNLGQNSNLTAVGYQHGLDACVILNPGTLDVSANSMATTMEAILGAVELDGGLEALTQLMTRLGLVHEMLTLVVLKSPLSLCERCNIYTINVMTSSALPLAISGSSTHGFSRQYKNEPSLRGAVIPHIVKARPMAACA